MLLPIWVGADVESGDAGGAARIVTHLDVREGDGRVRRDRSDVLTQRGDRSRLRLDLGLVLDVETRVGVVVVAVVVFVALLVVFVLVATVFLGESEVRHGLAQCACHLLLLGCGDPLWSGVVAADATGAGVESRGLPIRHATF